MLVLSNEQIESLVSMRDCLVALEEAYRALGRGDAVVTPRIDAMLPLGDGRIYSFKQMGGVIRGGVQALRINSDVLQHPVIDGNRRRVKRPEAEGRWVGLIYLFDPSTGMPLAIMPDGVIQHLRVGATNGLGARYLAPENVREVALMGTGWQAEGQLLAVVEVLRPDRVRIFSPNAEHRQWFCRAMQEKVETELVPVTNPDAAVDGVKAVFAATNSVEPVLDARWIQPGVHFSTVKAPEVDAAFLKRVTVYLHTRGQLKEHIISAGPVDAPEAGEGWWRTEIASRYPDLLDLVTGRAPGRRAEEETTIFVNNIGLGVQFAAVGALVLRRALERGVGQVLPDSWFTESVHP